MKHITVAFIFIISFLSLSAQSVKFDWVKTFGGSSWDGVYGMELDASGNIYLTGIYSGSVDFDPGPSSVILTTVGLREVFIAKYTNNGNLIWAKSVGGTSDQYVRGLDIDAVGNVYVTGRFSGTVDFDPGSGTYSLTSGGQDDAFVLKLDANGNFGWAASVKSSGSNYGWGITVDNFGHVYATGYYSGTVDFDPGPNMSNLTSLGTDVYTWKLDTTGNFIWARSVGGSLGDHSKSITTDPSGNVLVTGSFQGTADFDPGLGSLFLTSAGASDAFILKLNANGNLVWAKSISSSASGSGNSILTDASGDVYVSGLVIGTTDFDPGSAVFSKTSNGGADIFVIKLSSSGNFDWAKTVGGVSDDIGNDLSIDINGYLYVTGMFEDSVDFDPDTSVFYLPAPHDAGLFIQKFDTMGNFYWARGITENRLIRGFGISNDVGGNIYISGEFTHVADFDPGIDTHAIATQGSVDFFIEKLIPCTPNYGVDIVEACNSFTWLDGVTYTANNDSAKYFIQGGNSYGCDSIVTLNLTILHNQEFIDVQQACDSFMWVDGNTYTSNDTSAIYIVPGGASNGCDSVLRLDLTINKVDPSLTLNGNTATAQTTGASYQWLNCDNNFQAISGETSQSFTAVVNGNYALVVTKNGCSDTSECFLINGIGISEREDFINWKLYPNPTKSEFHIVPGNYFDDLTVEVRELSGKLIYNSRHSHKEKIALSFQFPSGMYLITLKTESSQTVRKIIVE